MERDNILGTSTTTTIVMSGYTGEERVGLGVRGWTRQSWTGWQIGSQR